MYFVTSSSSYLLFFLASGIFRPRLPFRASIREAQETASQRRQSTLVTGCLLSKQNYLMFLSFFYDVFLFVVFLFFLSFLFLSDVLVYIFFLS